MADICNFSICFQNQGRLSSIFHLQLLSIVSITSSKKNSEKQIITTVVEKPAPGFPSTLR